MTHTLHFTRFLGLITFSFATLLVACPGGKGMCTRTHPNSMYFMNYADDLKLSDSQVAKLNKIRMMSEKEELQFHMKSELAEQELMKVSHDPQSDRKKVEKAIDAVVQAEKDSLKSEAMSIFDARDVLTPEQLKKLREMTGMNMKACCHGEAKESK